VTDVPPTPALDVDVRPARPADVHALAEFIRPFVEQRRILPRTEDELVFLVANGFVAERTVEGTDAREIVGFAALEIYSPKLAEVRSLAVRDDLHGRGIGGRLVRACVDKARDRHVLEVMAITSSEEFFRNQGFDFTLPGEKKALFVRTREDD
jgi:amino-acid N-acetyltransferase